MNENFESAEKKFYLKHANEIVDFPDFESDLNIIFSKFFDTGKRYSIINDYISSSKQYNQLVEIGPGKGATLKYFKEKYNFNKIIGFDLIFSKEVIDKNKYKNVELIEGNFNYKIPLPDNSVDCLILMMVIEHLFDPFYSFEQVKRLLAKDGLAFINLPLVTSFKNRFRLLTGRLPVTSSPYNTWFENKEWDGNHLHYFNIESIKRICKKNDLRVLAIKPVGNFLFIKRAYPNLFCDEISFCVKKI